MFLQMSLPTLSRGSVFHCSCSWPKPAPLLVSESSSLLSYSKLSFQLFPPFFYKFLFLLDHFHKHAVIFAIWKKKKQNFLPHLIFQLLSHLSPFFTQNSCLWHSFSSVPLFPFFCYPLPRQDFALTILPTLLLPRFHALCVAQSKDSFQSSSCLTSQRHLTQEIMTLWSTFVGFLDTTLSWIFLRLFILNGLCRFFLISHTSLTLASPRDHSLELSSSAFAFTLWVIR